MHDGHPPCPCYFENQSELEQLLSANGASGLRNGRPDLVNKLKDIEGGDTYTLIFNKNSQVSKLAAGFDNHEGMLKSLAAGFEQEVSACALHCIALHCIALHCIAFYCVVLYCIASYHIAVFLPLTVLIHFIHRRHLTPSNRNSMRRTKEYTC
jgi:hypothetical protein